MVNVLRIDHGFHHRWFYVIAIGPTANEDLRLLNLLSGEEGPPIECILRKFCRHDAIRPSYEAVSYLLGRRWRNPDDICQRVFVRRYSEPLCCIGKFP